MATYSFINNPNPRQQIVRGDQPNRFAPRDIDLQEVTDNGSTTTNSITAQSFIGDGSQLTGIPKFTFFV